MRLLTSKEKRESRSIGEMTFAPLPMALNRVDENESVLAYYTPNAKVKDSINDEDEDSGNPIA